MDAITRSGPRDDYYIDDTGSVTWRAARWEEPGCETEHAAAQRRGKASHAAYYRGKAAEQAANAESVRAAEAEHQAAQVSQHEAEQQAATAAVQRKADSDRAAAAAAAARQAAQVAQAAAASAQRKANQRVAAAARLQAKAERRALVPAPRVADGEAEAAAAATAWRKAARAQRADHFRGLAAEKTAKAAHRARLAAYYRGQAAAATATVTAKRNPQPGESQLRRAAPHGGEMVQFFYDYGDGTEEEVTLLKLHSEAEGGGATILFPCGRERQTTIDRLRPEGANA
jgi:hypothetical protein